MQNKSIKTRFDHYYSIAQRSKCDITTSFMIPEKAYELINAMAKKERLFKSDIINCALGFYLEHNGIYGKTKSAKPRERKNVQPGHF